MEEFLENIINEDFGFEIIEAFFKPSTLKTENFNGSICALCI